MTAKKGFYRLILGAIVLLAALLRLYRLSSVPISLLGDEIDVGYQTYSLLKTGRDYLGQFLPFYLHSLSEWRAPLLMYFSMPFIAIFGLNEYGVRLPVAFLGILNVLMIYRLVVLLFGDKKWALVAAFLAAINPWSIHYSRAAFEVNLLLFLFLNGVVFFVLGLNRPILLTVAAFCFGLTLFTYSTAAVFLPLLILAFIMIYQKKFLFLLKSGKFWLSFFVFLFFSTAFLFQTIFGRAGERFGLISVFTDPAIVEEIHLRRLGGVALDVDAPRLTLAQRIFINRPVYWLNKISQNYLAAFSPEFLFGRGDPDFSHSAGKVGEFYLGEFLLVFLGILVLSRNRLPGKWLVFFWLLAAPLPSALTRDGGNHATRLYLMVPPLLILSALGACWIMEISKRSALGKIFFLVVGISIIFNFGFYLHRYFAEYPQESWRNWQYGYKEAMKMVKDNQGAYDNLVINNSAEPSLIRYLFWTGYDPELFQAVFKGDHSAAGILPGYNGFPLGNVFFGRFEAGVVWEEVIQPRVLYLISQKDEIGGSWDWREQPPAGVKIIGTVNDPFNRPIFYLVTHE